MKTTAFCLLTFFFALLNGATFAQQASTEKTLLEETLMNYLDGGTNGDTIRLSKAFHPSASMRFVRDGKFVDVPISQYIANTKVGVKQNRSTRIVSYDIFGTAAQAKVEIQTDAFRISDYFNLLKIDGRWQIVSKIFSREEKPK